jgi:hypothetical protein
MRTLYYGLLAASLVVLGACDSDETHAGAPHVTPDAPPAATEREPAPTMPDPILEPVPQDEPTPLPQDPEKPSEVTPVPEPIPEPIPEPEPVDDGTDVHALAVARVEARTNGLRTLVSELRAAVEALGENATQEQRDGATAVGDQLTTLEARLTELRAASDENVTASETYANEAADELDRRAAELKALLPS